MREESWYKFLIISTILHFIVITALSIPVKKSSRKLDLSSSYSVGLVNTIPGTGGGGGGGPKATTAAQPAPIPEPRKAAEKPAPPPKVKRQVAATPKPVPPTPKTVEKETVPVSKKKIPVKVDTEAVSLAKKKAKVKETPTQAPPAQATPARTTPTREELGRLDERIRDMRRRTQYLDISQGGTGGSGGGGGGGGSGGGGGLPGSGGGGGRPLDPVSQRYMLGVWERIKNAWSLPGMSSYKKSLETVVTIKIRKDGRIVDINMEKRSGNRAYDESILRVLRAVDPLPPIPASLDTDALEIGFRFLPGDLS